MVSLVRSLPVFALAGLLAAPSAQAQLTGHGYLFGAPSARLSLRGGYTAAGTNSDLFTETIDRLTLDRRDFSGFNAGLTATLPVNSRLELGADVGFTHSRHSSEFRKFVDNNDQPIEQRTRFERIPVMAVARLNLVPDGRRVGRLAYIPEHIVPYLSAGAGGMYYFFEQKGDFVDYQTNNVFPGSLDSGGWTGVAMGGGGVDVGVTPMMSLTLDARYLAAHSGLSRDFRTYERIDLSGLSATVGLSFRL